MRWLQPIWTAPEGVDVLLYTPGAARGMEVWIGHAVTAGADRDFYPQHDSTFAGAPTDMVPSHWMPLPEPPPLPDTQVERAA